MGPRQRLITTAAALLAEEGVQAVTLRGIAKAAGVSHGAPLRHFTGRAQLLSAVAALGFVELRERGEHLPEAPPRARLLAACHGYLDFALAKPAMFELMFRHDLIDARDRELTSSNSAVFDFFADLIADVQLEGWREATDPRLLAASLWASLHGLAGLWLWGGLSNASFAESIEVPLAVTLDSYFGTSQLSAAR
ncbi:MAG: TetR family transcriptional regulator [Amycolatopsis sp.]|uniref:TetR/AcrR family transcriptional regulator n=1 Tax=Amycolatopsis sp. TaxID=37632 RepID=UPI00262FD33F|nr:TetR/AcrR family transcriptional regulator [Amycolatopsis sp.]MCU1680050.1 TetR family transcriptional regulator [Amycolatopsis sp.]